MHLPRVRQFLRLTIPRRPHAIVIIFTLLLLIAYFTAWRVFMCNHGRWYWNWMVSLHPALALILPIGQWGGPPDNPPRWIQEIYDAPHMSNFKIREFSKPIWKNDYHPKYSHSTTKEEDPYLKIAEQNHHLKSPSLIKLHIFSTVHRKAYHKRAMIRKHSPLFSIPPEYRHLIEVKFVMGHNYHLYEEPEHKDWTINEEMELALKEEQDKYGDLLRLELIHGENLREGKILEWIRAVGDGEDGGRESCWLFKIDDDTVLNYPAFLDSLMDFDPQKSYYLGTSLNRWPVFHHHFTGMTTGFSWPVVKTMAAGINKMSRQEIEAWWDDDVLTGEIMFCLPSGPWCQSSSRSTDSSASKYSPAYCDPHKPPFYGYGSNPPDLDRRTGLIRYDYVRHMGDENVRIVKGDIGIHGGSMKPPEGWEKEYMARVEGKIWQPPSWMHKFAEV
ncbi:uncharacterized protein L201_003009 [Kwoniella dendrophila CBS 6074]|uniref:Hexosyltransferase n=1 Tax=Kwoniella dendrophila CBS 6074 TaxID=1295534 RepID=A0AAX4JRS3_9TREE